MSSDQGHDSDPHFEGEAQHNASLHGQHSHIPKLLALAYFLMIWIPSFFGPYGYFIDELYYLACADRPDFGYVDHPPFSVMVLAASRWMLGDSLPALRFVPALIGALTLLLTCSLARRLGAGPFGQALAGCALMVAPIPLLMFGFYSMNGFGLLIWTSLFYLLVILLERDQPLLWLPFGLIAGIGLINKHTLVLFAVGLTVGVLATPARKYLGSRWLWLGAGTAFMILLPNLLWQMRWDWPSIEFYRNADLYKNLPTPPLEILLQQVLFNNPGALPIWLAGFGYLLFTHKGKTWRSLGISCLALLVMMVVSQKSRPDRIAGIYPFLFAAGAAWFDGWIRQRWAVWLKPALLVMVLLPGLGFLPISIPLLPPPQLATFAQTTGVVPQIESGEGKASQLPQWFADRLGWPEFVADIERVVDQLPPDLRENTVIIAPSYGHAGALELLGRDDLPPTISPQNTYFFWAKDTLAERDFQTFIAIHSDPDDLRAVFEHVERVAIHRCDLCIAWRSEMPIYVAKDPKYRLADIWDQFKNFT